MKAKIVLTILSLLLSVLPALSGCRSAIGAANASKEQAAAVVEYALSAFYSEEDGYHFPGFRWGEGFGAFQRAAGYPISNIAGYAEDGTMYDAENWHVRFGEQVSKQATVGVDNGDRVCLVLFEMERDSEAEKPISKAYFEAFAAELTALFGEAEISRGTEESGTIPLNTVTYKWERALPTGEITTLQWASATEESITEPKLISFVVGYYTKEEESSEAE